MNSLIPGEKIIQFLLTKGFASLNNFNDCQEILIPENDATEIHSWVNIIKNWGYDADLTEELIHRAGVSEAEFRDWLSSNY